MPTAANVVNATGLPVVTTAETIIAQTPARQVNAPGSQGQWVQCTYSITPGAGTTSVTTTIYRVPPSGANIPLSARATPVTAAVPILITHSTLNPLTIGQAQYLVTVIQTGATGNGTVNEVTLGEQTANAAGA